MNLNVSVILFKEIVQGNDELCELLLELCINKNDIDAVNYWSKKYRVHQKKFTY